MAAADMSGACRRKTVMMCKDRCFVYATESDSVACLRGRGVSIIIIAHFVILTVSSSAANSSSSTFC
eukprot:1899353-Rhodomonas_salina.1